MVSKGKLFWMLSLAMLTAATAGWSAVVKKQIGGVYYIHHFLNVEPGKELDAMFVFRSGLGDKPHGFQGHNPSCGCNDGTGRCDIYDGEYR